VPDSAFNATRFDGGKYTAGLDGESYWGHAFITGLNRNTSNFSASAHYYELGPTFRADNGFEPQNAYRCGSFETSYTQHFDKSPFLDYINWSADATRKWNFDDVKKDEWVDADLLVQSRAAQTYVHLQYMASDELFQGVKFKRHLGGARRPQHEAERRPEPHRERQLRAPHRALRARHGRAARLRAHGQYQAGRPPVPLHVVQLHPQRRREHGGRLFSQSVFWSRLSLQVSRELSMRFVSQYNDRWKTWDFDPLVTYRINSLTMFYVGSTHTYQDFDRAEDGPQGWTLADRQFFMKLQYLFQI